MSLFKRNIINKSLNVQILLNKIINTEYIDFSIKKEFLTIKSHCKKISIFIKQFIHNYKHHGYHSSKIEALDKIHSTLSGFSKIKNNDEFQKFKQNLILELDGFLSMKGSVFLFRHPDKPSLDESNEGLRLSRIGIKQARDVGKRMLQEILIIPGDVKVEIHTSEITRTQLLGRAIGYFFSQASKSYDKKIEWSLHPENINLKFPHLGPTWRREYEKMNENDSYKKFMKGKYTEVETPKGCANIVYPFMKDSIRRIKKSKKNLIIIGITHSFRIDAFINYYVTKHDKKVIGVSDFIKFENDEIYFENKWYKNKI